MDEAVFTNKAEELTLLRFIQARTSAHRTPGRRARKAV
jgi:hypothetical protein